MRETEPKDSTPWVVLILFAVVIVILIAHGCSDNEKQKYNEIDLSGEILTGTPNYHQQSNRSNNSASNRTTSFIDPYSEKIITCKDLYDRIKMIENIFDEMETATPEYLDQIKMATNLIIKNNCDDLPDDFAQLFLLELRGANSRLTSTNKTCEYAGNLAANIMTGRQIGILKEDAKDKIDSRGSKELILLRSQLINEVYEEQQFQNPYVQQIVIELYKNSILKNCDKSEKISSPLIPRKKDEGKLNSTDQIEKRNLTSMCEDLSIFAEIIMTKRQGGANKQSVAAQIDSIDTSSLNYVYHTIVDEAYKTRQFHNPLEREVVIKTFKDETLTRCLIHSIEN